MTPCPHCNGTGRLDGLVLVNTSGSGPEAIRDALARMSGTDRPTVICIGEADSPSFMADLRKVLAAEERYEPMPKLDLSELTAPLKLDEARPMSRKQRRDKARRGKK